MTEPNDLADSSAAPTQSVAATATRTSSVVVETPTAPPRWAQLDRLQKLLVVVGHLAFWPFNLFFCSLALLGYAPLLLLDLVVDAFAGITPLTFAIGAVLLAAVPVASTAGGLLLTVRRDGRALLWLLVGVEVPAMWLLMTRTFGMQELSGGASLFVVGGVVGLGALFVRTLHPATTDASATRQLTLQPFIAMLLPIGAFVVVVMGSLALPLLIEIAGDINWSHDLTRDLPLVLLAAAALLTFMATPFLAPLVWLSSTIEGARALWRRRGPAIAVATTVGPVGAFVVLAALLWPSPGAETLKRLATLPTTDAERQQIVDDGADIRAGLVDAAVASQRYLMADGDEPWVEVWDDLLGRDEARLVDGWLRRFAAPFVYPGDRSVDERLARQHYRELFGDELERAERAAVLKAMAATYTREQRFAGLINVGEQRVRLVSQQVTATPTDHGTVIVEVHDEWSNLTPTDLEIQLSFALPPTTAVTGLWLNDVDDKERAFPFALAPRGAAQQVYREQVQRRVDPALLEQVGPQQYRLRVFPVPAKEVDHDRGTFGLRTLDGWRSTAGKHAHVWLTYETLAVDGVVPVPTLLEARNAFFDDVAVRSVQGQGIANADTWVPVAPKVAATTAALTSDPWRLADGSCVAITAQTAATADFSALRDKAVDVVIDRSLTMAASTAAYADALAALGASGAQLETVWTSSTFRNEPARREAGLPTTPPLWFGTTSLKEMLTQRARLPRLDGRSAAVVIVLAAKGSFESSDDAPLPAVDGVRHPIGVLHLGGLPTGYDDATADAVSRSGGIITTSLADLAAHLAGGAVLSSTGLGVATTACTSTARPATALVARLAVRLFDRGRDRDDPTTLDRLHAIALSVPVVTPYSSMIVLVNEEQRERLRQLNAQRDRYEREVEDGAQIAAAKRANGPTMAAPHSAQAELAQADDGAPLAAEPTTQAAMPSSAPFIVQGTPEPEEWLLLLIVLSAVGAFALRRRPQAVNVRSGR